jgi:hypothetical protein
MFVTCGCVVRSALCMLAMHKLTLGAPLHVSRSSQDATSVTGSGTGSMHLTAGAELQQLLKKTILLATPVSLLNSSRCALRNDRFLL